MFAAIGTALPLMEAVTVFRAHGVHGVRIPGSALLRFVDTFASMTADLTLLLATLPILTGAFVTTGVVPPKVGFILVEAASVNLLVAVFVVFLFGALLGMGLPLAPTCILTALVFALIALAHSDPWVATAACIPVVLFAGYRLLRRRGDG